MYNYKEYKKLKEGTPTCGECKFFISSEQGCFISEISKRKYVEEHYDACTKFDSHYEG